MVDFVIVPSDLRPHVLDTQVKRGAKLSPDHLLGVSWIRGCLKILDRPGKPKRHQSASGRPSGTSEGGNREPSKLCTIRVGLC